MRKFRLFISIMVIICFYSISSFALETIPDKIRIGLYYLEKSVNTVELSTTTDFEIGYIEDDIYTKFYLEPSKSINLKKDYTYHIQVGDDYQSYEVASEIVGALNNLYNAYVVYDTSWKVFVGSYDSQTSVNNEISKIRINIPEYSYTCRDPSTNSIQVFSNGQISFIYNGEDILKISSNNEGLISVNGNKYRGSILAKRQASSDMTIINEVLFNEYLYSVVPSEMPSSWHIEALKAQAVAARTYAVNSLLSSPRVRDTYRPLGFDMTGTTEFQVYNGYSNEAPSTMRAVDETNGQIIYHNNSIISAMFFSCSGGFTENSENIWISEIPYLKAVEDKYILPDDIIHKTWEVTITPSELKNQYISQNSDIGDIKDISVSKYTPSGNAIEMKVVGTNGEKIYQKLEIRGFIAGEYLSNLAFKIQKSGSIIQGAITSNLIIQNRDLVAEKVLSKEGLKTLGNTIYIKDKGSVKSHTVSSDSYTFRGVGAGHGVGMSQYGARGMAQAGFSYTDIIKHFYTGVEIKN